MKDNHIENCRFVIKSLYCRILQITIFLFLPETLGQAEDQVCAGPLAVLLCIQLGYGTDSERIFKLLKSPLITTLQDPTARIPARASVSKSLFNLGIFTVL